MKIDVGNEIIFSTARSGGKGGQNVNKVETMVEGRLDVSLATLFSEEQKQMIQKKLANKITADGLLLVKSQTARTQLANKKEVVRKINALIQSALQKQKARVATKRSKASVEKRLKEKKTVSEKKSGRNKVISDKL